MKVRIQPIWDEPCGLPKCCVIFGYSNQDQNNWHYRILYLGLILVFISWGTW